MDKEIQSQLYDPKKKTIAYYMGLMTEGKMTKQDREDYNRLLKEQYVRDFPKSYDPKKQPRT